MYRTALCAQDSQPVRLPAYVQAMTSLEPQKYESNCMKFSLLAGSRPLFIYLINSAHEIVKMTSGAPPPLPAGLTPLPRITHCVTNAHGIYVHGKVMQPVTPHWWIRHGAHSHTQGQPITGRRLTSNQPTIIRGHSFMTSQFWAFCKKQILFS